MSVLTFVENWDGKFKKLTFELVSYAAKVAEMMNTSMVAVSIGQVESSELEKLSRYGAGKIINISNGALKILDNQVYAKVISDIALQEHAAVIVFSNNNSGKAIAPRVSVKLKAGIAAGVMRLPLSLDPFMVVTRVYSGKAFSHLLIKSPVKILTLSQNSYEVVEHPVPVNIETVNYTFQEDMIRTNVTEVNKQTGKVLLTDAEIVVSGGRGMKSPDNWAPLVEFADLLGAATACSRPVSDEGWRPHDEHTGQTGKIIAPNLYFAFGISGATQHIAGVSSSKYIVAVNTDKDAPVFEAAQYGIIGDAAKVLPKLITAVREIKAK